MSQQRLRRGNWSVQELERLRLLLPNRGVEQTAMLLRRSPDSVLRKALDLLRVAPRKGAWTSSDDWQLRQAWGAVELRLLAPMLGRPASEVRRRANELRERRSQGEWSRSELQLLKKLYGTRSDADLEVSLMRSRGEITAAAKRLCLAKDKRFQAAQAEKARVRSSSELSRREGAPVTPAAGAGPRKRSSMPRWTTAEVELLRELYPDEDNLTVARALGRSVTSVANKAYQLGIHKTAELLTTIGRSNIALRYSKDDLSTSSDVGEVAESPTGTGAAEVGRRPVPSPDFVAAQGFSRRQQQAPVSRADRERPGERESNADGA